MAFSLFFLCFLGCMIYLYVGVCFVLPWKIESFPFMFWRWRNKLKWAPFEIFAPSSSLRVGSWLHPFKGHCEQKAMRDDGVIYVVVIRYWIGYVQGSQSVSISKTQTITFKGTISPHCAENAVKPQSINQWVTIAQTIMESLASLNGSSVQSTVMIDWQDWWRVALAQNASCKTSKTH